MSRRRRIAIVFAGMLAFATLALGAWVLVGQQRPPPERAHAEHHAAMMGGPADAPGASMPGHHEYMLGPSSRRGALGGWLGVAEVSLVVAFLGLLALLLGPLLGRRRLRRPAPARCPRCTRPVETDWSVCPFCEAPLAAGADGVEPGEAP